MRIAYFDCFSGISGDMTLGALIDAGADVEALRSGLATLGLPGWELRVRTVKRHQISATDVDVHVEGMDHGHSHPHPTHSHGAHGHDHGDRGGGPTTDDPRQRVPTSDRTHDHGHDHPHVNDHDDDHGHPHEHGHVHSPSPLRGGGQGERLTPPHHHAQPQRHLSEIREIIRRSSLPEPVKERAIAIFQRLGEAEARIHACAVEEVHFHEVGAVDSIVDITGSVLALHLLGVDRVACSPLPTGRGFVRAAHGLMPVPAPATLELLRGLPVVPSDVEAELVTPTGACLMACLAKTWGPMPPMRVEAIGYGAGKKELATPNLLRVCIGEALSSVNLSPPPPPRFGEGAGGRG